MASTYQTVRYGSTGSAVRQLQSALNQRAISCRRTASSARRRALR